MWEMKAKICFYTHLCDTGAETAFYFSSMVGFANARAKLQREITKLKGEERTHSLLFTSHRFPIHLLVL